MTEESEIQEITENKLTKGESKLLEKELNNLFKSINSNIDSLSNLLKKDNKFLEKGQVPNIVDLLDKKRELLINIKTIQDNIKSFLSKNNVQKDEKLVQRIKINYQNLQDLMERNEVLLVSNIEVSNKLIEIYQNQKKRETIGQSGYDETGKLSVLERLERIMPSISLNNKI